MTDSILVINCGSSSIKFALYPVSDPKQPLITALAERLGEQEPILKIRGALNETVSLSANADHRAALTSFTEHSQPWLAQLQGIGHRVVHGGERYHASILLDDSSIQALDDLSALAPLHNPVNVLGIRLTQAIWPQLPQVAVFDTAFHQSIPEAAYLYGVPYDWYEQDGVRRYGFHGTSYRFVTAEAARRLNKAQNDCYFVIAHLGNGCSACAVAHGESVDSSMGLTPLEGLVMGTRSGDIDPAIPFYMMNKAGISAKDLETTLNKKSGVLGITEQYVDRRDIEIAAQKGDKQAELAIDVESYRIRKYVGAYAAAVGGIDAVVFTAGVGERGPVIRSRALEGLGYMGVHLDEEKNALSRTKNAETDISTDDSPVRIFVIPTDEELVMTEDTYALVNGTYDVHTSFSYTFQDPGYINVERDAGVERDLRKIQGLERIVVSPRGAGKQR